MSWIKTYFQAFPDGSAGKKSARNVGDLGSIPELGRSPGEGKSYLIQYSGLKNSGRTESDLIERFSLSWLFSLGNELTKWVFN